MTRRNLIIIHRGPEYDPDFETISLKVRDLDPDLVIYSLPARLKGGLPEDAWQHPTLTVALQGDFRLTVKRGPVLRNRMIGKLDQQAVFRRHGIPTPPALPFRPGMALDPILFGDFVVLKPADLMQTSSGEGILFYRRATLQAARPEALAALPRPNPATDPFIVQRFVHSGPRIAVERVTTLLGDVISQWRAEAVVDVLPASPRDMADGTNVAVQNVVRDRYLTADTDAADMARRVAAAYPDVPLLGVDILREPGSGRLHVLECNAGGNTWFFSSDLGAHVRQTIRATQDGPEPADEAAGKRRLLEQFDTFDIAARALHRAVTELAR